MEITATTQAATAFAVVSNDPTRFSEILSNDGYGYTYPDNGCPQNILHADNSDLSAEGTIDFFDGSKIAWDMNDSWVVDA